jgi:hypothetical protein
MFHRIRHGVAVSPQTFGLDPFVQNPESAFLQHILLILTERRSVFMVALDA